MGSLMFPIRTGVFIMACAQCGLVYWEFGISSPAPMSFIRMVFTFTLGFVRSMRRSWNSFFTIWSNSWRENSTWLLRILSSNTFFMFAYCLMSKASLNARIIFPSLRNSSSWVSSMVRRHHPCAIASHQCTPHAIDIRLICYFYLSRLELSATGFTYTCLGAKKMSKVIHRQKDKKRKTETQDFNVENLEGKNHGWSTNPKEQITMCTERSTGRLRGNNLELFFV